MKTTNILISAALALALAQPALAQGGDESRTVVEVRPAAHAAVDVPAHDGHALARSPGVDRRALGFRAKVLLLRAGAPISNSEERSTGASALRHAPHHGHAHGRVKRR